MNIREDPAKRKNMHNRVKTKLEKYIQFFLYFLLFLFCLCNCLHFMVTLEIIAVACVFSLSAAVPHMLFSLMAENILP